MTIKDCKIFVHFRLVSIKKETCLKKTRFNWLFLQEFGQQLGCHLIHSKRNIQVARFHFKVTSKQGKSIRLTF